MDVLDLGKICAKVWFWIFYQLHSPPLLITSLPSMSLFEEKHEEVGEVLRTPASAFDAITDFPYRPYYVQVTPKLRMAVS